MMFRKTPGQMTIEFVVAFPAMIAVAFVAINGSYMDWNYNNPELAVAGTILHGFEFVFVRLAPIVFAAAIVGIVMTYKRS